MTVELKPYVGRKVVVIYGFPTSGKSSAQRAFRFLGDDAKDALGIPKGLHFDFTDTDDYFGEFKMSQQTEEKRKQITDLMWSSLELAASLSVEKSHLSVIFTNFNHCYNRSDYDAFNFVAGFIPASEEDVEISLKRRQPNEWKRELPRYLEWYREVNQSPLVCYLKEKGLLVEMKGGEHLLDYLTYDGKRVPFVDIHIRAQELNQQSNETAKSDIIL